jgi:hypothetical protein
MVFGGTASAGRSGSEEEQRGDRSPAVNGAAST